MGITRKELIEKYLKFFQSKGHKVIPSASLVPANDSTVLFTTAGMHPLVPYLLGQKHPLGKKIVNVQKVVRTGDIEEVGDTYHHTFFEMLGNWSLGDYFKEDAIKYSYEFLTSKKWLGLDKNRIAVSCFAGDKDAPKDRESEKVWRSLGIPKERIAFLPKENNWWGPAGLTGPCGPDTEMFYWKDKELEVPKKFNPKDERWVEIWNDVFMQYNKIPSHQTADITKKKSFNKEGKLIPHQDKYDYRTVETKSFQFIPLKQPNVDTGMGVERTLAALNNTVDNYETDVWKPIIKEIESLSGKKYKGNEKVMRVIADHIKATVFIIADGVHPGNAGQGYVLRRLIRRAVRYGNFVQLKNFIAKVAEPVFDIYEDSYSELKKNKKEILQILTEEEVRFNKTLEEGERELMRIIKEIKPSAFSIKGRDKKLEISGKTAFLFYQSYGFPLEFVQETAKMYGIKVDVRDFEVELQKHQSLSRTASAGMFKSGLSDHSEKTTRLHTATHLLNEALREVLGNEVKQRGSNITNERLRFDFNFPRKLTDEEIKDIERIVNDKIMAGLEVKREEASLKKALASGAQAEFGAKYPEIVSVYTIGSGTNTFSREICTGPHVKNTRDVGKFKIIKEESSAAGIRRIKAVVG